MKPNLAEAGKTLVWLPWAFLLLRAPYLLIFSVRRKLFFYLTSTVFVEWTTIVLTAVVYKTSIGFAVVFAILGLAFYVVMGVYVRMTLKPYGVLV